MDGKLTRSFDEALIMFTGQQRIRQISKELLQQASDTIHIVVEMLRIAKIHLIGICICLAQRLKKKEYQVTVIKQCPQFRDMCCRT